jgi:hypothetical protein
MNIHSLYVTRSKDEREYFYELLGFMRQFSKNYKIVHLDFKWDSVVTNMKFANQKMIANIYSDKLNEQGVIYNFEDLLELFKFEENGLPNAFVYSGHSNGIHLMKHNIRILRVEDFCELSFRTLGKKADVLIFDCCLCGNISVLNICYNYTNYLIASTSYWSNLSILFTHEIYKKFGETMLINSIKEFIKMEESTKNTFKTDIVLYKMNKSVLELINVIKLHKPQIKDHGNYIIDKRYYKDLQCALKESIDIQPLLDKIILFKRFEVTKCHSRPKSKRANSSWPSDLSIILKNPIKERIKLSFP